MKLAKRILIFASVNILIVLSMSLVLSVLGVQPYLDQKGINLGSLAIFCLLWGFGGAFVSLALSRVMAKMMMGVRVVDPRAADDSQAYLVSRVHALSRAAGLSVMPEVGIYESDELNAFATGPTRSRALVAVSSGLLRRMNRTELDGVLAHEVAHIANGDMVTMTLVQGVVNALVMFAARIAAWFAAQFVDEEKRAPVQMGVTFMSELLLGVLGMVAVAFVSRAREYRADAEGARLAGPRSMIAALEALRSDLPAESNAALATLKISGGGGGLLRLFSTHPPLAERIERLRFADSKYMEAKVI